MSYALLYILIGALLWHFFKRQILTLATWLAFACVLYGFVRAAPSLGLSSGWLMASYGGGVVGFVVGAAVALKPLINFLVESDFKRAVERERGNADRRRV